MQTIRVLTRFDITNTDIIRPYSIALQETHPTINSEQEWIKARRQQINFETIVQILSLRTQPTILAKPRIKVLSLSKFGVNKKGKVWVFTFSIEHDDVYTAWGKELGLLETDAEHVPMILKLNETITDTFLRVNKNIYFEVIENDL